MMVESDSLSASKLKMNGRSKTHANLKTCVTDGFSKDADKAPKQGAHHPAAPPHGACSQRVLSTALHCFLHTKSMCTQGSALQAHGQVLQQYPAAVRRQSNTHIISAFRLNQSHAFMDSSKTGKNGCWVNSHCRQWQWWHMCNTERTNTA